MLPPLTDVVSGFARAPPPLRKSEEHTDVADPLSRRPHREHNQLLRHGQGDRPVIGFPTVSVFVGIGAAVTTTIVPFARPAGGLPADIDPIGEGRSPSVVSQTGANAPAASQQYWPCMWPYRHNE